MADRGLLFLVLLHCLAFLASAQQVNVANGKPANASSQYNGYFPASSVTDGATAWNNYKCYHSADNFPDNWLRVYLGTVYPMNGIVIYYRSDFPSRFVGTTINILNSTVGPEQKCATVTNGDLDSTTASSTFSCTTAGSIVELRKDRGIQNVCEVQVWVCPARTYTTSCTSCGACLNGADCDSSNGTCPAGGCDPGWKDQRCDARCDVGSYGAGCGQTCGNCTQGTTCDHVTGDCPSGCQPGWRDSKCTTPCSAGSYGANCTGVCGKCAQGVTCDRETGDCPAGCQPGWKAPGCRDMCEAGNYGAGCGQTCGKCTLGTTCHHVNGSCLSGCQPGWQGSGCTSQCDAGSYGAGCGQTCAQCLDGTTCDHVTGNCPSGCKSGWEGAKCNTTCQNQMYGRNCSFSCGQCQTQPCHHVNGSCTGGCVASKTGNLCKDAPTSSATIGGAVGGTLAFIVVLVVVVVAVWLVRRRQRQQGPSNRSERLTRKKKSLSAGDDESSNGQFSSKQLQSLASRSKESSGYFNVALEQSAASSGKPAVRARKSKGQGEGDDVSGDVETSHYYNVRAARGDRSKAGIPVASFPDYVKSMKAEMKFQPEYESVPSDFLKSYEVSQMKEHAGKNKFKTYYPYDENRVVLELVPGDPNSHYINASHVDGIDSPKAFIAAQAPTKVTLPDFLRMIWQQNCSHVVMLANLWEEGRVKSERYFPENVGEDLKAGEITVTLAQETTYSYCIVRLMTFSHKNGESRTIRQFHFTTWPDHGVPSHVDMLDFFWKVRASWTPASGPLLVHCSAGVGRTGTFIALCLLNDQAASQHTVDPLATLTALRHQRRNMIQTVGQYEFLHEVLERVLVFGKTAVSKTVFADHYKRLKGNTFMGIKTLDQIKEVLPSLCVARRVETFQTFDDSNVYSNTWNFQDAALHLSSVRLSSGYVQVRLCEAGQEDVAPKGLWSFLSRVSSSVLVDVHSAQKACVRQPGEAGEMEDGSLTVQWQAPAALASGVTLRSVLVKDEDKETQVTYLSYNWRKAEASRGLVPTVSHLCKLQLSASPSPITFIYRNADDEQTANMLCASLNVAETILMDSEVELVNNILRVNASFPPETVVRCAEFAKAFMQVTDVYANA